MTSAARAAGAGRLVALADELVALDLDDAHAREATGREPADPGPPLVAQVDDTVDLGRLPGGAALPRERRILADPVDQHLVHGAEELALSLPCDGVLALLH